MLRCALLCAFVSCSVLTQAFAKNENTPIIPAQPQRTERPSDITVPLLSEALHLSDFPSQHPTPGIREKLVKVSGFVQNSPRDGEAATEDTEVWLGHTRSALYVVFICRDHRPAEIRGHLARRENILKDDNVAVLLDPFQDRRKGVLFKVNPAGVQADAEWSENSDPDYSYDQVWDSEAHVTPDGWMALISIPFQSLRYRSLSSDWGVVFSRSLPRNSEVDYWPRISAGISGVLSQEGTLHGMTDMASSHNLQLNPYVLAQNERSLVDLDPLNPYFSSRHLEGAAGGEAKVVFNESLVLDATINPDFSTVESEQPQFTVNQRYAVYFPELRPFFLENANYFATPIDLVYTRNIVHPTYGVRMTGKVANTNVGAFLIDDRDPGETAAAEDPLYGKRATFAVGRVSQDFGRNFSAGAIYTDREFGGGWNRVGGVDFTSRMNEHWTLSGQAAESSTQDTSDGGGKTRGPALNLEVQRNSHAFNLDSVFKDYGTNFQTQVGFIPTSNIRSNQTWAKYKWFPSQRLFQTVGVETSQSIAFDHQGNRVSHYSSFDPFVQLPRRVMFAPIVGQSSDTLGPQDGTLLTENENFTQNYGGLFTRGAPLTQLSFNVVAVRGGNVNYNPPAGGVPSLLNQQWAEAYLTLQPLHQLTADNTYLLDRDFAADDNAFVYESQTLRTRVNYQFTRAFSARVIVEYDSTLANPLETSLQHTKQVGTEALLTWLPHPGTAIYVGYNDDLQNLDRSLCNRLANGACDPDDIVPPRSPQYLNDSRQIFVKASYLFRF